MSLVDPEDFGTETDGSGSAEYCTHCFQQGSFTEPEITLDQMADVVAGFLRSEEGMGQEEAGRTARVALSGLGRWRTG
jgi:hypothetical protein